MSQHPWSFRSSSGPFRRRGRAGVRVTAAAFHLKPRVERLEDRELLAVVSVNAGQVVRPVDTQLLGVNLTWWDTNLNTSQTQKMVQNAGLTMFRFPGRSEERRVGKECECGLTKT